jgi:hypothetical protein
MKSVLDYGKFIQDFGSEDPNENISLYKKLGDDLEEISGITAVNQFIDKLLPWQKESVRKAISADDNLRKEYTNMAILFDKMGKDKNGNEDEELTKDLQDDFYFKRKEYKSVEEILSAALVKIRSANNGQADFFIKKIDEVNKKFGNLNGAKIEYQKNGFLVIEVLSYIANTILNGHTKHCTKDNQSYWDKYVEDFSRQLYLYNFNLDKKDNYSVIGVTIDKKGNVTHAHLKDDENVSSEFKNIIGDLGIPLEVFSPLKKEEYGKRMKRDEANTILSQILKKQPPVTKEEIKTALENGGNINYQRDPDGSSLPLKIAVLKNDMEFVKFLLENGADINLGSKEHRVINSFDSKEMFEFLVKNGAEITEKAAERFSYYK